MKAMLFAAGLGTRLRPYTASLPKALIELGGRTILQIIAERLIQAGVTDIVVNVHHFAGMMKESIDRLHYPGVRFFVSDETGQLLDTGGGLRQAQRWLDGEQPFFLHNADVLSGIDLKRLHEKHQAANALVTLAVSSRPSTRYFLWDGDELAGWENTVTGETVLCRKAQSHPTKRQPGNKREKGKKDITETPMGALQRRAYSGIAVISPEIFGLMTETGVFSIRDVYLRLAERWPVRCFEHEHDTWFDIGTPGKLERARRFIEKKHNS